MTRSASHGSKPEGNAPQVDTATQAVGSNGELFSCSYELTNQLVDEAATALAGDSRSNPAMLASYGLLVVILLVAMSPIGASQASMPVLLGLILVEVGLWVLARRWHDIKLAQLRRNGLDTALIPERQRRREVRVYEDRVVVAPKEGTETTYATAGMRKPKLTSGLCLLRFAEGAVPVPSRAMSVTRYEELVRWACKRTGAKVSE